MRELFRTALDCLATSNLDEKQALAKNLWTDWQAGKLQLDRNVELPSITLAGRPQKPELVAPRELPRRRLGSKEGHAAMIHAIGHIEFNAINLACDAVYRFRHMPRQYYADWLKVASEEAYHFSLIAGRLAELGFHYGDFPAHNGLWDLAVKTAHDPLVRMALVPRVMEARGLDVTPGIMRKFSQAGDQATVEVLKIILRDEVGHVEAGTRWFRYLCDQRGLEPEATYFSLLEEYFTGGISCPLHVQARLDAGFTETELDKLEAMCAR